MLKLYVNSRLFRFMVMVLSIFLLRYVINTAYADITSSKTVSSNKVIKGSFYNKKQTKAYLTELPSILKKANSNMGVDTVLQVAYTIWAEEDTITSANMYRLASIIYNNVNMCGSIDYLDIIHKKGEFKSWGKDGYTQVKTVNKNFVFYLEAIKIVVGLETKDIKPISTNTINIILSTINTVDTVKLRYLN